MFTTLNKIKGTNRYCGPSAMSAIFGIKTETAARLIRQSTGITAVKGLHDHQVMRTFEDNGIKYKFQAFAQNRPTLNQFTKEMNPNSAYMIAASCHWIAVCNGQAIDKPWMKNKLTDVGNLPKKKSKVTSVIEIISGSIKDPDPKPTYKTPPKDMFELIKRYGDADMVEDFNLCVNDRYDWGYFETETPTLQQQVRYFKEAKDDYQLCSDSAIIRTVNMLAGKYFKDEFKRC